MVRDASADVALYADGVNVHANLMPRAEFRRSIEGSLRNSFMHALVAKGRLLYSHDPTIADLTTGLTALGERDKQLQLLHAATSALPSIYKAHKWFVTRGDLDYTALWILYAATPLARIEIVGRHLIADRKVIPQAMALNPVFFGTIYHEPRVRHDLCRRTAAVHGIALYLCQAICRAGDQARRGLRVRPLAGHLDRAETLTNNPRSTVSTMTDIASYLNLLYATIAQAHCPRTGEPAPTRSSAQILEAILSLPEGSEVELRAPVFRMYGEDLEFVFTELRKKGCRRLIADGTPIDLSTDVEVDESSIRNMDAVVDRFVVHRQHEKAIKAGIANTLLVGDGLLQVAITNGASKAEAARCYAGLCSATHHLVYGDIAPGYFMFNNPRRDDHDGKEFPFGGIARRIERYYRRYRQRGETSSRMEQWLEKVMVERTCPDCHGSRLRQTRRLFEISGRTLFDVGQLHFDELHAFLGSIKPSGRGADAGRQVLKEIRARLELLLGIGLDYLNFNRRSSTLSGGESQRIRLSTQIGSGLMGMLYVLDERVSACIRKTT